jgi:tRNA pseudouridine55 synthase
VNDRDGAEGQGKLLATTPASQSSVTPMARCAGKPCSPSQSEASRLRVAPVGILNVNKPAGPTSHDVVQTIRRAANIRRVGHAGTLDPLAAGVLVVCLGPATRVIDEIQGGLKRYQARVRLGAVTTTFDAEGKVMSECEVDHLTPGAIEAALAGFRGEIHQLPPMHSALKRDGRPLYELARAGIEVARETRVVTVHELAMTGWSPPDLDLSMTVSRGTYVRALAHDLGQALGVGGYLAGLTRTAVGRFTLVDAVPLETAVAALAEGWWEEILWPPDTALLDHPAVVIDAAQEMIIRHGQQLDLPPAPALPTARMRAYNAEGDLVAVLRWQAQAERWQPDRVFAAQR